LVVVCKPEHRTIATYWEVVSSRVSREPALSDFFAWF
jgi:hypothetical protein